MTANQTKAAHTPGPWLVNPFRAVVDADRNGTPSPVCKLAWPTDDRSEEETMANARLIAAAPLMLDALKAAEQWLSGWASAEGYLDTIRAAIKAAEPTHG